MAPVKRSPPSRGGPSSQHNEVFGILRTIAFAIPLAMAILTFTDIRSHNCDSSSIMYTPVDEKDRDLEDPVMQEEVKPKYKRTKKFDREEELKKKEKQLAQKKKEIEIAPLHDGFGEEGRRLPNVLLGGTQKADTDRIAQYIQRSTPTCISSNKLRGDGIEAHYFDMDYEKGLHYYARLFQNCTGDPHVVLDATPEIMIFPERVQRAFKRHGTADQVKLIFVLREPVAREIAWYLHRVKELHLPQGPPDYTLSVLKDFEGPVEDSNVMSFEEVMERDVVPKLQEHMNTHNTSSLKISYDERSLYAPLLKRWFHLFDRKSQILILQHDEIALNEAAFLTRIHQFLGIPIPKPTPQNLFPMQLPFGPEPDPKEVKPSCVVQRRMSDRFGHVNEELYALLKEYPGPPMEKKPFPKFELKCKEL